MTIRPTTAKRHRKNPNKGRARLKYGGGYKGLAMAICNGDRDKVRQFFGV